MCRGPYHLTTVENIWKFGFKFENMFRNYCLWQKCRDFIKSWELSKLTGYESLSTWFDNQLPSCWKHLLMKHLTRTNCDCYYASGINYRAKWLVYKKCCCKNLQVCNVGKNIKDNVCLTACHTVSLHSRPCSSSEWRI